MISNLKIVIVDDEEINLFLLEEILLSEGYKNIYSFAEPKKALNFAKENEVDALITDYHMPKMDGLTLLQKIKDIHPNIVSIMITTVDEDKLLKDALEMGVTEFLTKPISPIIFKLRLKNILKLEESLKREKDFNIRLKSKVIEATTSLIRSEHESLEVLSKSAEYKDPETASHIARVAYYSKMLARTYGLNEESQEIIFYSSPLHDVGKIGIEDSILLKPGKLTDEEFERMKEHSIIGAEILRGKQNPYLVAGEIIALTHHEKYNGKGYPEGLKGEDIPLYGRIVAVADVFDALTSKRPYKKAWSFEKALDLLIEEKGQHFDPKLIDLFVENIDEVKEIYLKFKED